MTRRQVGLVLVAAALAGVAAAAAQPQPDTPFDRWDRNGDGKLARDEVPEGPRALFDRVDTDGDGFLSRAEDRAFRARMAAVQKQNDREGGGVPAGVQVLRDLPYAGTDNPRQKLDLILPRERKGTAPLPLVAFIHGGAWLGGDRRGGVGQVGYLVAGGDYVGATIGYRLSGEATWPAQAHDVKAAIRWLRAHAWDYGYDPDRIAVMGSSAGGHLVALLGTTGDVKELEGDLGTEGTTSSRVQAVVDLFGPADFLHIAGPPSQIDHAAADSPEARLIGGAIQDKPDAARAVSPITYVSKDDPPFLLIHGDADPTVPFDQSARLDQALKAAGVPSALLRIAGGGHGGFRNPAHRDRIRQFLDATLRKQGAIPKDETLPNDAG
jgi:acetyl esterase/lipase